MSLKKINPFYILIFILILGAFLRFYKLDWGGGYFFNPDENDIEISVNQLSANQMHPHLFKYGTVNIYLIYFTKRTFGEALSNTNSLLIGRFYSALFSTFTILIVYLISKKILSINLSLVSAFLVALTPGLIQQAHFATPETNQTFFLLITLLFLLRFLQHSKISNLLIASGALGLALGVKVSSIAFLPAIVLTLFFTYTLNIKKIIIYAFLILITTTVIFALSSPYTFIDYQSFYRSILFEKQVATGEISVFYTRQFINTTPILFQLKNVFPFTLGPVLQLLGLTGLLVVIFSVIKRPNKIMILITGAFLFLFFSNGYLFVKWTRYMATTLPFFALFAVYLLYSIQKKSTKFAFFLSTILLVSTAISFVAFFTIYINHDTRIEASNWFYSNIPRNSIILVEGANVIDVPINGWVRRYSLDFYNLDRSNEQFFNILTKLEQSDYFIVQSRRVFFNHQRLPNFYPKTAKFYDNLFNGQLGFEKIKEFRSYPSIPIFGLSIEFPDEGAEETWSVFDHPVIRIFKKNNQLTKEDYLKLFFSS